MAQYGCLHKEIIHQTKSCWRTFPSPPSLYSSPPPGGAAPAAARPVVVLLGWAGCRDRHLAKYSAIYSHTGCATIRYTAPWRMVFFSESFGIKSLQTPAKRLLELLFDYSMENRPILFHVFSNGGVMLYRYILEALHTQQPFKSLRVVGTIFDSAPGRRNLRGGLRALETVLIRSQVHTCDWEALSGLGAHRRAAAPRCALHAERDAAGGVPALPTAASPSPGAAPVPWGWP
uniref:Transmembrane protein 53 n=1 Tax=Nothoprocta perdicaria TaxID=30464 RepID=A0A8C6ZPD6_NOTPE